MYNTLGFNNTTCAFCIVWFPYDFWCTFVYQDWNIPFTWYCGQPIVQALANAQKYDSFLPEFVKCVSNARIVGYSSLTWTLVKSECEWKKFVKTCFENICLLFCKMIIVQANVNQYLYRLTVIFCTQNPYSVTHAIYSGPWLSCCVHD